MSGKLYHGGTPGLDIGSKLILPNGVYVTEDKKYARLIAHLRGLGDLYRVERHDWADPDDVLPPQDVELAFDPITTWLLPAVRVVAVVERAVRLTGKERRRYDRGGYLSPYLPARALDNDTVAVEKYRRDAIAARERMGL